MENIASLFVVSHTHWDREWYQTYQQYRARLVFLLDELIEVLESNAEYRFFHLDGQTIVLDDYCEIRPENRERLTALIRAGRLIIGPWFVMPDEFLVSAESLVRNLQFGRAESRRWGVEPMPVGYIVDIFGHCRQMPQVFAGFGIDSAVLFRGFGDYPRDMFHWQSPDGTSVVTAKLDPDRCYSNFYFSVRWPFDRTGYDDTAVAERAKQMVERSQSAACSPALLMMDGVDHIEAEPQLPHLLDVIRESQPHVEVQHARLVDYFAARRPAHTQLETIVGELYNIGNRGLNNRVLKNVLSSMVHLKQANDRCERYLSRLVEPFLCLLPAERAAQYAAFVDRAWRYVLENHPHDSICGCSISEVHADNQFRFKQALEIAQDVFARVHRDLHAGKRPADGRRSVVVYNPGQHPVQRIAIVEVLLNHRSATQLRFFDEAGNSVAYQVMRVDQNHRELTVGFRRLPEFSTHAVATVALPVTIPALGFSRYGYDELVSAGPADGEYSFQRFEPPYRIQGSMRRGPLQFESDHYLLDCGGPIALTHKASGRRIAPLVFFEDDGDVGEGWNYIRPADGDQVFSTYGQTGQVIIEAEGPFAVQLRIEQVLELPVCTVGNRRSKKRRPIQIVTTLRMTKDDPVIALTTTVANAVTNHRLRVLVPTLTAADHYYRATPFSFDPTPIGRQDDTHTMEPETGVMPNQGVVALRDADGVVALFNRGLYEVEVRNDQARTVAFTLFRSFTEEIGRDRAAMAKMLRTMRFEFALAVGDATQTPADIAIAGTDWRQGLACAHLPQPKGGVEASRPVDRKANQQAICAVDGALVVSSIRRGTANTVVVRVFNPADTQATGTIRLVDAAVGSSDNDDHSEATRRPVTARALLLDEETVDPRTTVTAHDAHAYSVTVQPNAVATIEFSANAKR